MSRFLILFLVVSFKIYGQTYTVFDLDSISHDSVISIEILDVEDFNNEKLLLVAEHVVEISATMIDMKDIPSNVYKFKNLKNIDFSVNDLVSFNLQVDSFKRLESLDLSHNKIESLEFFKKSNLKSLNIRDNNLKGVLDLRGLICIEFLDISHNDLTDFKSHKNVELSSVKLGFTKFESENICHIVNSNKFIQSIDLSGLVISKDLINGLEILSLSELYLKQISGVDISTLLSSVNFSSLEVLDISENQLDTLLGCYSLLNIRRVNFSSNKFSYFPSIKFSNKVEYIDISKNDFLELPIHLVNYPLVKVYVDENLIRLSREFLKFPYCNRFILNEGRPL